MTAAVNMGRCIVIFTFLMLFLCQGESPVGAGDVY